MTRLSRTCAALSLIAVLPVMARAVGVAEMSRQARVDMLAEKPFEGPAEWETTLAVGFTLTSGNRDTLSTTTRLATEKLRGTTLALISAEGAYGEVTTIDDDGYEITQQTIGNVHTALMLRQRVRGLFVYSGLGVAHDVIAEVNYRGQAGLGLGTFLIDDADVRLSLEGGVGYLLEEVSNMEDDYATLRLGQRLDLRLSATAKVWQAFEYLPEATDLNNYLAAMEGGIETVVNSAINLGVVGKYAYDSTPGKGLGKDDLSVTARLSVRL